ncbi:MAG: hypothetical protein R3F53_08955 [Gammaproteobacteria bacterium]
MPSHLTIRYAGLEDVGSLAALAAKAFSDTYHGLDDPQEIADYVAENFNRQAVASVVSDPNATTLLAEVGTELARVMRSSREVSRHLVSRSLRPSNWPVFISLSNFIRQEALAHKLMRAVHREASPGRSIPVAWCV